MNILNNIFENYNKSRWGISDFCLQTEFYNLRLLNSLKFSPQSIISVIFPYFTNNKDPINISKYAIIPDYHLWVKNELEVLATKLRLSFPENKFSTFTDNSPIFEVQTAINAGIGFRGKNNLLITKDYGSYVFIGEIITNKVFPYNSPCDLTCGNCNLCENACKSGALNSTYELCTSFITQKKGALTNAQQQIIRNSNYIWGCDDCQDACPYNKNLKEVALDKKIITDLKISDIDNLSNNEFREKYRENAFTFRGKNILIRNISIKNNIF